MTNNKNIFVISLEYKVDLNIVNEHLENHRSFLKKYYSERVFIASGPKNPRTGGMIIATANNVDDIQQIISEDPFSIHKVANYSITEFSPTMCIEELLEITCFNK